MGSKRGAWRQHSGVSAGARGYDAAWQRLRLRVLSEEPLCRSCRASPATEADHIVPLSKGGKHSYLNTRLAHIKCNVQRGNRGAAQIPMLV